MSAPSLQDLIAKLESAESGSRELDAEIWRFCEREAAEQCFAHAEPDYGEIAVQANAPLYTRLIDVALTLVRPDCAWMVHLRSHGTQKPFACVYAKEPISADAPHLPQQIQNATGNTPALAVCIAALCARSVQ